MSWRLAWMAAAIISSSVIPPPAPPIPYGPPGSRCAGISISPMSSRPIIASRPVAGGSSIPWLEATCGCGFRVADTAESSCFDSSALLPEAYPLSCCLLYCILARIFCRSSAVILFSSVRSWLTWRVLVKKITAELLKKSGRDELWSPSNLIRFLSPAYASCNSSQ